MSIEEGSQELTEALGDGEYQQIKIKCFRCGLHFIVCTEDPGRHSAATIHCPECGQAEGEFVLWRENVPGFIFEAVPGDVVIPSEVGAASK